jgi:predicted phage tail protein
VQVDFSYDSKLLYGSNQYALEQARGKAKIDLKAAIGVVDPSLFNNIFFGLATAAGETLNSIDESATPASGTFTVANAATFSQDLGVYNTVTGLWMTRVAATPAAGQYAVNTTTGVYTTSTSQNGQLLKVSYTYASAASGSSLAFTNQIMGSTVIFSVQLVNKFKGADNVVRSLFLNFPAVQCPKLSMPLKLDDFTLPQLEMSAQDNGSGNVFNYSMTG